MNRKILIAGAVLGVLSVVLGAFAAHGLKPLIAIESMHTFETGVRYQMYHAIFLLFVGSASIFNEKTKKTLFLLVVFGVLLFSGSIYGLATNILSSFDFKSIAFATPLGGLLLISAWVVMLVAFIRVKGN